MARQTGQSGRTGAAGFTLVEVVLVIVLLSLLSVAALPRALDLGQSARVATLEGIAGTMRSSAYLTRVKARAAGLQAVASNPGGNQQSEFLVDFPFGSAEVDWRNLCPESEAELGARLSMLDFLDLDGSGVQALTNNQYTLVGFDIPGFSVPTGAGCYVIYDSFGDPDCTVTVVTADC